MTMYFFLKLCNHIRQNRYQCRLLGFQTHILFWRWSSALFAILPVSCEQNQWRMLNKRGFETVPYGHDADYIHISHTIVSLYNNPKQWLVIHMSDLMKMIRLSTNILTTLNKEMGKLKTHSPLHIYNINDSWKNVLNLRHTLDRICLTNILYVRRFQISENNDDKKVWCGNKRIWHSGHNVPNYLYASLPERTRGRPWGRLRVRIRSIEKTSSWKFYPAAQNFTNRMLFRNTYIFKTI